MTEQRGIIAIERMMPSEYGEGGKSLSINYSFPASPFGDLLIASTSRGICCLIFAEDHAEAFSALKAQYPQAHYQQRTDVLQQSALVILAQGGNSSQEVKLHLKGTDFQIEVWKTLLNIPFGLTATYGDIAKCMGYPRACRAVGTAVGKNLVALLIPCHRIIRATGELGNYHWGQARKKNILDWEKAKVATPFP